MEPVYDPAIIEPWVERLIQAEDAHERDDILLQATQQLSGPAALWREDSGGGWHEIAGSSLGTVDAHQVAAVASGALTSELPLAQVVVGGEAPDRRAVVMESDVGPELAEGLLVLASLCAEPACEPRNLLDLFQGPLRRTGGAPGSSPEASPESSLTRPGEAAADDPERA